MCLCSYWWLKKMTSIIYHLIASTRANHKSCLLLLDSSFLLISKVQLMDNSLYLWGKLNQYLDSFMFLCTVCETTKQIQEGRLEGGGWGLWMEERTLTKQDGWLTDLEPTLNSGNDSSQVQCSELHFSIKPCTEMSAKFLQPITASTLFMWDKYLTNETIASTAWYVNQERAY